MPLHEELVKESFTAVSAVSVDLITARSAKRRQTVAQVRAQLTANTTQRQSSCGTGACFASQGAAGAARAARLPACQGGAVLGTTAGRRHRRPHLEDGGYPAGRCDPRRGGGIDPACGEQHFLVPRGDVEMVNGFVVRDAVAHRVEPVDKLVDRRSPGRIQVGESVPERTCPQRALIRSGEDISPETEGQLRDHLALHFRESPIPGGLRTCSVYVEDRPGTTAAERVLSFVRPAILRYHCR
jgi:hypothetical protein